MEFAGKGSPWTWFSSFWLWLMSGIRKIMLWIIMGGPIPIHIAIIMDGNRRFAQKQHIPKKSGHEFGAESLMQTLRHCYDFGVKYVTIYAFSIENFRRSPDEVEALMELMRQKLQALLEKESLVNQLGIRVRLLGDLDLLPPSLRQTAEKVMACTMTNNRAILNVCIAYTSIEEMTQAVAEAGRRFEMGISVDDIERHLYTVGCPEPDLLIRTSGETRLSNFLLWQLGFCYLHACGVLWPEFTFRHLFMAVLDYQRAYPYLKHRNTGMKILAFPLEKDHISLKETA